MSVTKKQLEQLKEPLELKWRCKTLIPDNSNPTHMIIIGYVDARQVYDRLDQVLGPENWQDEYFECKNKQFCKIGVKIGDEWIWKGDSGSESSFDATKGETSDSFKRAAVHWGINRSTYELGEVTINCKMVNGYPAPCDESGNVLKGEQILTECKRIASGKSELFFDRNVLQKTTYTEVVKPEEKKTRRKKTQPKIIMP
ncbi:Rad52/Rad22 family DNA repair protein [Chryseobacterium indologenes]|uniref:Rad52/Rad22 family DNA repair protein n=1 Tax=Chryseobacterium indologenes TaxID=253 RepID=UPI001F4A1680|nr:Rad52/Rad22 family DNA repair protein [Chryseobacterium indologenes]